MDMLFGIKQKHNHIEQAWDVSNSACAYLEYKYAVQILCGGLAWNHELSAKVNLYTYEKEVIFGSS